MKERPNIAVEEDTEEMKRWRSLNHGEMDLCWKKVAERMEEEVLDKIEHEEEESWRERDQIAAQWDEEQQLEEILEQRRMEGSSLQLGGDTKCT